MRSIHSRLSAGRKRWLALAVVGLAIAVAARFDASGGDSSHGYALDTTGYSDLTALTTASELVVVGRSDGEATIAAVLADGLLADFEQRIAIRDAVVGLAADEITIVRLGANPTSAEQAVPMDAGDAPAGPVPRGDYLLFLQQSGTADVWSVVGHEQGVMEIDGTGRVISPFADIDGRLTAEAVAVIKRLAEDSAADAGSQ